MIYEFKDFSFVGNDTLPEIQDGDSFVFCNLTQEVAGTEILKNIKNLSFISCNCQNIVPQPTWEDFKSNWSECEFISEWVLDEN